MRSVSGLWAGRGSVRSVLCRDRSSCQAWGRPGRGPGQDRVWGRGEPGPEWAVRRGGEEGAKGRFRGAEKAEMGEGAAPSFSQTAHQVSEDRVGEQRLGREQNGRTTTMGQEVGSPPPSPTLTFTLVPLDMSVPEPGPCAVTGSGRRGVKGSFQGAEKPEMGGRGCTELQTDSTPRVVGRPRG